jgi:xanthine/uracil permease
VSRNAGLLVIVAGVVIVLIGLLIWSGALSWFGRLPGDIRYEGENTQVFIPITSGIVASIVLTVVINVVARLFR